ncbi:22955_t:CDS:2, partial [Gigaspora margarita]
MEESPQSVEETNNHNEIIELDEEEDNDPDKIMCEIPVYLSQKLTNKLFIVQHPVRPRANPYIGKNTPREARFKPHSQKLELDIPLQTTSQWYDRDRGAELALGLNDKEARTIYDRTWRLDQYDGLLDKQTLQSTIVPPQSTYWMGAMKDNALHLTPVHATLQLRPGLKYHDKIDEKNRNANKKAQVLEEEDSINELKSSRMASDDQNIVSNKAKGHGKGKLPMSIETDEIFNQIRTIQTDPLVCTTTDLNEYLDKISASSTTAIDDPVIIDETVARPLNKPISTNLRADSISKPTELSPARPHPNLTARSTPTSSKSLSSKGTG